MIELKHVSKTFDTGTAGGVDALKDVSLTIEDGDIYGIIGMSGAGKSTLVRCINLLEKPTSGEIIVNGQRLDTMTPAQLSGGQQQRVAIARALATHPKVLLCDEATSALDPNTTRQILELIRDINQKLNITVVVITHQMSVVKEICSHVAILDEGRVAESGLVGTVFAAPKSAAGRRLVFPGGADAQVYDPSEEKLVRLVFKDSKTTSIPLIARLAAEENIFCNVISASTQKLSEEVYGSMMLGIPSSQFDKAVSFIHNVANVEVEEVE